ncbi:MAG: DUF819 family protein [Acidobacteriota bacterium]|nr:DUF819 family protein [Acidobacteriota bacterium]
MSFDTVYVLAVLCLLVAASEWLVRRTALRHVGSALLVILLTAVVANLGGLPTTSTPENPVPVYGFIFSVVAPLSILWLLLAVNLRDLLRAGGPIIALFLIGSLGTVAGVLAGMVVIQGPSSIGELYAALGGMFVGTYTGGSVNFNALALHYEVMREGVLFGGAVVVDNIVTAAWMMATLALPRVLLPLWKKRGVEMAEEAGQGEVLLGIEDDTEDLHPLDLGLILALGLGGLWVSDWLAALLAGVGWPVPSILILTALALGLAQIPAVARLKGARSLGMFAVYLFLAVIGAFCDLGALAEIGELGGTLLLFAATVAVVHGAITFGAAWLLDIDLGVAAVASQANIGGATSALALARSLGRNDLVLPGVLVGSLGLALGTFLGFWTAQTLLPGLF